MRGIRNKAITEFIEDDPFLEIAKGNVLEHTSINKFGANTNVASDTTEDVWDGGGTYSFPATALITSVSQTANQATLVGGTIEVQGLNASWNLVTQTIDLDGADTTTVVTLGTPLIRVFRMKVLENVVTTSPVRAHNAGETVDYAIIGIGNNQTLMAIYTVPAGKTAYMTNYYCDYVRDAVKDPDGVEYSLWFIDRTNNYAPQIKHRKGIPKQASGFQHFFRPYYKIEAKTDILITALPTNAGAFVHAGFDLIIVDN